jgi:hypothetical protein
MSVRLRTRTRVRFQRKWGSLLAVAGYQNRDKIAEMLRNARERSGADSQSGIEGLLGQLGLGGASTGGLLSGEVGELWTDLRRAVRVLLHNLGSTPVPTNHAAPSNLSRQLVLKCWKH